MTLIRNAEKRKDELLDRIAKFGWVCGLMEKTVFSYLIVLVGSRTKTWESLWSDLQVIQRRLPLDETFHGKLRKESLLALGLFFSLV